MSFAFRCSLICMGRLIYGFNVSVDGYIADAQGKFTFTENKPGTAINFFRVSIP